MQRILWLGSYRTTWAILHKLRRAMARLGRDRFLQGVVEVDETNWSGVETGVVTGRLSLCKVIVAVAAQPDGLGINRIQLRFLPDVNQPTLHDFIRHAVEPGSTVITGPNTSSISFHLRLVN